MKRIFSFFILFLTWLCGCVHGVGTQCGKMTTDGADVLCMHWHGDVAFTDAERKQVQQAMSEWYEATNGLANLTITWDLHPGSADEEKQCTQDSCMYREDGTSTEVLMRDIELGCSFPCILGWTITRHIKEAFEENGGTEIHLVWDRVGDTPSMNLYTVTIHELGHAMDMAHVPNVDAIMYKAQNPAQSGCPKQADISEFCRVHRCGTHKMNPCTGSK